MNMEKGIVAAYNQCRYSLERPEIDNSHPKAIYCMLGTTADSTLLLPSPTRTSHE
jgi:hypothetical protein